MNSQPFLALPLGIARNLNAFELAVYFRLLDRADKPDGEPWVEVRMRTRDLATATGLGRDRIPGIITALQSKGMLQTVSKGGRVPSCYKVATRYFCGRELGHKEQPGQTALRPEPRPQKPVSGRELGHLLREEDKKKNLSPSEGREVATDGADAAAPPGPHPKPRKLTYIQEFIEWYKAEHLKVMRREMVPNWKRDCGVAKALITGADWNVEKVKARATAFLKARTWPDNDKSLKYLLENINRFSGGPDLGNRDDVDYDAAGRPKREGTGYEPPSPLRRP